MRVTPVVLGEVVLVQIRIGLLIVQDPGQPHFFHQSILMMCRVPVRCGLWLATDWRR